MSKEEYLSFKLAKPPTNLKVGDPGCIICDSCGGFCADPNGSGCNAQAENLCPAWVESGKKLLADGVLQVSCFNPDKSPCVGGLYGVRGGRYDDTEVQVLRRKLIILSLLVFNKKVDVTYCADLRRPGGTEPE